MTSLLGEVMEAHGDLDRWRRFSKVEADTVTFAFGGQRCAI